jgi:tetratricopeptide (TPR) repeat protein
VGNQREMDESVESFRQAIARAPDYALARAGLASAYAIQAYLRGMDRAEVLDEARIAVERALELDPELAEALAASVRAAELDPLSVGPVHDIAINHMVRHDYEQAAAHFRRAIDINPNWTWGYIKLARTLAHQKKCPEALAQAEVAERRIAGGVAPLSRSWLGYTYAICGEEGRARETIGWLRDLARKQYVDPVTLAVVHGGLGEMDEAIRWYEKAFEDRTPNMVYAGILPRLNPEVAGNERYEAIVRRMGFPPPS